MAREDREGFGQVDRDSDPGSLLKVEGRLHVQGRVPRLQSSVPGR